MLCFQFWVVGVVVVEFEELWYLGMMKMIGVVGVVEEWLVMCW